MTKLTLSLILIMVAPVFGANRTTEKFKCTGKAGVSFEIERPISERFAEASSEFGQLTNFTAPKIENGVITPNQFVTVKSAKLDLLNNMMGTKTEPTITIASALHPQEDTLVERTKREFFAYLKISEKDSDYFITIKCRSELASSKEENVSVISHSMDKDSFQFTVRKSKITILSSTHNSVVSKVDFVDEVFVIPRDRKVPSLLNALTGKIEDTNTPTPRSSLRHGLI